VQSFEKLWNILHFSNTTVKKGHKGRVNTTEDYSTHSGTQGWGHYVRGYLEEERQTSIGSKA
jgi:hypothetical protein